MHTYPAAFGLHTVRSAGFSLPRRPVRSAGFSLPRRRKRRTPNVGGASVPASRILIAWPSGWGERPRERDLDRLAERVGRASPRAANRHHNRLRRRHPPGTAGILAGSSNKPRLAHWPARRSPLVPLASLPALQTNPTAPHARPQVSNPSRSNAAAPRAQRHVKHEMPHSLQRIRFLCGRNDI